MTRFDSTLNAPQKQKTIVGKKIYMRGIRSNSLRSGTHTYAYIHSIHIMYFKVNYIDNFNKLTNRKKK